MGINMYLYVYWYIYSSDLCLLFFMLFITLFSFICDYTDHVFFIVLYSFCDLKVKNSYLYSICN